MYYVKAEVAEGVTIRAEVAHDNVFNQCPRCGMDVPVDLADIVTDDGLNLYGTAIYCDKCSASITDEQAAEERCHKSKETPREAEYYDSMTAAMKALAKVWEADGITTKERGLRLQAAFPEFLPKQSPEAFTEGSVNKSEALKKWVPDEENDWLMAVMAMRDEYRNTAMAIGEDHPATKLARETLKKVQTGSVSDYRGEIQAAVINQVAAFDDSIEDAAGGDEELASFYRRVLGISEEV